MNSYLYVPIHCPKEQKKIRDKIRDDINKEKFACEIFSLLHILCAIIHAGILKFV